MWLRLHKPVVLLKLAAGPGFAVVPKLAADEVVPAVPELACSTRCGHT